MPADAEMHELPSPWREFLSELEEMLPEPVVSPVSDDSPRPLASGHKIGRKSWKLVSYRPHQNQAVIHRKGM